MKHMIWEILARTFNRMTTYLSIFNFCMLCIWLYESDLGSIFKDNGLRPGDAILIVLFAIILITSIEMIILGFEENE
jgi:uncharacterized membrane protein